jgi:hypothetical protein
MCKRNGITHSTSTSRNPQGNSLIKSIHKTIAQVLQVVTAAKNPNSIHEGEQVIHETLDTTMHACHCACSSSLGHNSPGALAFNRDMFLDIPLSAEGAAAVENAWLAQYPKRVHIVTDQGPEFGRDCTNMCNNDGITHSTSASHNRQGNSLI